MNKSELILIRDYNKENDKAFVIATWLRGLYYGDTWFALIKKQTFMNYYAKLIEMLIDGQTTKIKVACLKEDPTVIIGYVVLSRNHDNILHWAHVKKPFRGIGVAKDLTPKSVNTVTHLTKPGVSILKKKEWLFNPFLLV
jgi:hypothetical protein